MNGFSLKTQNYRYVTFFLLLLTVVFLSSCNSNRRYDDVAVHPMFSDETDENVVGRFKTAYLAEQIDEYYKGVNPGPIGVSPFVNIDDLHSTSTFGRMIGEQLMSELAMRGYDVVEMRHSQAIQFVPDDGGEFALSRNVNMLKKERELGGIVVGTYVVSPERVYLNTRLLNPANSYVLSAASAEMSKTPEIKKMLRSGGNVPTVLERVPIQDIQEEENLKFFDKDELKKAFGKTKFAM